MAKQQSYLLLLHSLAFFLLLLASTQSVQAVVYKVVNKVPNSSGGKRFDSQVGRAYARTKLSTSSSFIWKTFKQTTAASRKPVPKVTLIVESMPNGVAYTLDNEIHLSAEYVKGYTGNVKREITGVLYHEMTHVRQWNGKGKAPGGLIEGIADYVRLKAGYAPSHWVKPGEGNRWDQGYDVTAHFLSYCNSLKPGFVAKLNGKMKNGWSVKFFDQLLGKSVNRLWKDYKAKYNK